ncbi:hypothetical protein [Caballeronia sp. J97]|uniref:hypothetical protein n=1 Tax=Caballeronia sp. J97 TaxID=2805429 RepID=UPI002AB08B5F|nr:hypothetical protein [Caballeronia sp. J97]
MIQRRKARSEDVADEVFEELQRLSGAIGVALAPTLAAKVLAIPDERLGRIVKVYVLEAALQERLLNPTTDPDGDVTLGISVDDYLNAYQGRVIDSD